jgi:hypothetical protein
LPPGRRLLVVALGVEEVADVREDRDLFDAGARSTSMSTARVRSRSAIWRSKSWPVSFAHESIPMCGSPSG